ncbi:MAG: hypothetical protein WCF23_16530 [Candidatus Nitrosopolaris sp.]
MIHSDNCNCLDHQIWRKHSEYCNCNSCKAVVGVACDSCGIVSNPSAEPRFQLEDGVILCEECESERHRGDYDEDIQNILRIDPDLDFKEQMK